MLLVNNIALGEFTPATLMHAPWNQGVTMADWVFPWFLLMVGLSIPFSVRPEDPSPWPRVVRRGAMIFFWGLVLQSAMEKRPAFTLGVLQLIGLAYIGGFALYRLPERKRWYWIGGLLGAYGAFALVFPFPGGPGFEEKLNVFRWVNETYLKEPFRLAGLLSVIPTAPLVALGAVAGQQFVRTRQLGLAPTTPIPWLLRVGAVWWILGVGVNLVLPYNKPVWTPSYILLTGALGLIAIALLTMIIEVSDHRDWTWPFVVLGTNALLAYVGPILVKFLLFKAWTLPWGEERKEMHVAALDFLKLHGGPVFGGAAYTGIYIGLTWLALAYCYRRRWFLRA